MNDRSVGENLHLLFVGYAIALAIGVLRLFGISGGIWGFVSLASLIVIMIGLKRLSNVHRGFGRAFGYEVILIVFAVISAVLLVIIVFLPLLEWLLVPFALLIAVVSDVFNYFVIRHTCLATADLAGDAGDLDTAALGTMVNKIYLLCFGVSVVCTILGIVPILGAIFNLLGKLASLASIAGLGLMVYFLYRAKTSLS